METEVCEDRRISRQEYSSASAEPQFSKRLAVLTLLSLSAVFIMSIIFRPSSVSPDGQYYTICGFKMFTALPCPGCGLTHSLCAIGKGDLPLAFAFNLLGPPLFLVFLLYWLRSICVLMNWKKSVLAFDHTVSRLKLLHTFVIAFAVIGFVRILYILIWHPAVFKNSPLVRLITYLTS